MEIHKIVKISLFSALWRGFNLTDDSFIGTIKNPLKMGIIFKDKIL
jgi:hypothetical protein